MAAVTPPLEELYISAEMNDTSDSSASSLAGAQEEEEQVAFLVIIGILSLLLLCGAAWLLIYLRSHRPENSEWRQSDKHISFDLESTCGNSPVSRSVTFLTGERRGSMMGQLATLPQERSKGDKYPFDQASGGGGEGGGGGGGGGGVGSVGGHHYHGAQVPFSHLQTSVVRACKIIKQKSPTIFAKIPRNFEIGEKIGSGSNGVVHKAYKKDGTVFAIKTISVSKEGSSDTCARLMKEVNIMVQLRNDHVIHFMGCKYDKVRNCLNIFMEHAEGGSLGELSRGTTLTESRAKQYLHDILQGIRFLHSKGVIHRDIKGDNILLTAAGRAKISDFGACKELEATSQAGTMIGTPLWMAPEAIIGEYCFASDIWSVGCVVVEMLNGGAPPWEPFRNHWQAMLVIGQWKKELPPLIPEGISLKGISFLKRCFAPATGERATPVMLLSHPFMISESVPDLSSVVPNILSCSDVNRAGSSLIAGDLKDPLTSCTPASLLVASLHSSPNFDAAASGANASLIAGCNSNNTSTHNSGNASNGPLLSLTTASPLYTPPRLTPVSPVSLL